MRHGRKKKHHDGGIEAGREGDTPGDREQLPDTRQMHTQPNAARTDGDEVSKHLTATVTRDRAHRTSAPVQGPEWLTSGATLLLSLLPFLCRASHWVRSPAHERVHALVCVGIPGGLTEARIAAPHPAIGPA